MARMNEPQTPLLWIQGTDRLPACNMCMTTRQHSESAYEFVGLKRGIYTALWLFFSQYSQ